jgi:hypothetical protein
MAERSKGKRVPQPVAAPWLGTLRYPHIGGRERAELCLEYLIERNAEFGRGLAYATGNPRHLLNVRAGNMSAFSGRPGCAASRRTSGRAPA